MRSHSLDTLLEENESLSCILCLKLVARFGGYLDAKHWVTFKDVVGQLTINDLEQIGMLVGELQGDERFLLCDDCLQRVMMN